MPRACPCSCLPHLSACLPHTHTPACLSVWLLAWPYMVGRWPPLPTRSDSTLDRWSAGTLADSASQKSSSPDDLSDPPASETFFLMPGSMRFYTCIWFSCVHFLHLPCLSLLFANIQYIVKQLSVSHTFGHIYTYPFNTSKCIYCTCFLCHTRTLPLSLSH